LTGWVLGETRPSARRKLGYFLIPAGHRGKTHPPTQARQQPLIVEGRQRMQLLQRHDQRLDGRGVHEVKMQQVVDPHRLQLEHGRGQVGPLYFRDRSRQHLVPVRPLRVQPVTLPRPRPAGASRPLFGLRLRDRRHHQRVHPRLGIVHFLLDEAGIHHVENPVDGQGSFRDVGRDHHFPASRGCRFEDPRLHFGRQRRIHRQDDQFGHVGTQRFHPLVQDLARGVDLFLTGQKQEDVPGGLSQVDLHHRDQTGVEVVGLWLFRVQHLHGERPTGDRENRRFEEILREFDGVEGCRSYDQFQFGSFCYGLFQQAEQDVRVDCPFVGLIQHYHRVGFKVEVHQAFA
jgi:hypothetical protein